MRQSKLQLPDYNPANVTGGIAHFGVGNFHRSHQAMYLDRLIQMGDHDDWGIIGVGVMPADIAMCDALSSQDFRYTLVEKDGDGGISAREIASIRGYLYGPDDPGAVLDLLSDPAIRIVSLTITEGGYNIDRDTGQFDIANTKIQQDLANPQSPSTVFGYIAEAIRRRKASGIAPFTVMSCDNLPGNGNVMKQAMLAYANALDPDLADWIGGHVSFPNSMVDRITPVTTDADRELVAEEFAVTDAWPVITEPFTQWVLEDTFGNGRPAFERVGVQLVDDVAPYEHMKLRLLNATHQAMAYIGMLRGHTFVHEAIRDFEIEQFLRNYLDEARITLAPVPGIDIDEYIESLFVRFENQYIADTLARLAVDASDRIPKFVLPTLWDNLHAGRSIENGTMVIAQWAAYLATAENVVDSFAHELQVRAVSDDALDFIRFSPVFGDLANSPIFAEVYQTQRSSLD